MDGVSSFERRLHPQGDVVVDVGEGVILHLHLRLSRPAGGAVECFKGSGGGFSAAVGASSPSTFANFLGWDLAMGVFR